MKGVHHDLEAKLGADCVIGDTENVVLDECLSKDRGEFVNLEANLPL